MKNLYKKITFFLFVSLLFFGCFCHFAYALEIKTYPNVPGLPSLTDKSDLTDYVAYFFGLIVYTAGAIATISFAIGAIQMIASAANPSMATEGKERMKGAVLGLILTLSAFVILKTINPSLVNQTLTPLPGVDGIFYQSGSNLKTAPQSESDTSNIPSGYNTIFYKCSNKDIAPALLVWLFVNKGQDPAGGVNVKRIECGGSVGVSGGSFQMAFETAGVYFCTGSCNTSGTVCSGYMSGANTYSQDEIEPNFRGNIKSIRIVQNKKDEDNPVYYGALVHQEPYLKNGGVCQAVTLNTETSC